MDTCHLTLSQIRAYEAASMDNINLLPYSEGLLEIQENVQTVLTMIQFLNTMIYNYGKMNCEGDVSDLSRPRKEMEQLECERSLDRFILYRAKKSAICHDEGYADLQEKFEREGCEALLNRIKSGEAAIEGGLSWLAEGGLNEGHTTNARTMRFALELLNAEFYYYSKMGCEADIRELVVLNK